MKLIKVDQEEQKKFVEVLIQDGYWFLNAAERLFSNFFSMQQGAVLAHHGIELLLKACWIWSSSEYRQLHDLIRITNQVEFLSVRNELIQGDLIRINTFYYFRYPMDSATSDRIQEQLRSARLTIEDIPIRPGELLSAEWERVERLRNFIITNMPCDLRKIYEEVIRNY